MEVPALTYRDVREQKYQVMVRPFVIQIPVFPIEDIRIPFVSLTKDGLLTVEPGFVWDGASGPTVDTANSMKGSLVHDALYALMRAGMLALTWRPVADMLLAHICMQEGMDHVRADLWQWATNRFAEGAAKSKEKPLVHLP